MVRTTPRWMSPRRTVGPTVQPLVERSTRTDDRRDRETQHDRRQSKLGVAIRHFARGGRIVALCPRESAGSCGMNTSVSGHCGGAAFIFVPNLCNAACSFCYVKPTYTTSAVLPRQTIIRASQVARALSELGFSEVRFTGGEPTVFQNLPSLVNAFTDAGLKYRVLTNGIEADRHMEYFRENPPTRFTISLHSLTAPEAKFRVDIDEFGMTRNRQALARVAPLECTLVVEDVLAERCDVESTCSELASEGVAHVKVILENSHQVNQSDLFRTLMAGLARRYSQKFETFRWTDTSVTECRLREKAFPAIDLGRSRLFACCVQVGDRNVMDGLSAPIPEGEEEIASVMRSLIVKAKAHSASKFACEAAASNCPLALAV